MLAPKWLGDEEFGLVLLCLSARGCESQARAARALFLEHRTEEHQAGLANLELKRARKEHMGDDHIATLKRQAATHKDAALVAQQKLNSALATLPNLCHVSVPRGEREIVSDGGSVAGAERERGVSVMAVFEKVTARAAPSERKTFVPRDLPLHWIENESRMCVLCEPDDGWAELERLRGVVGEAFPGCRIVNVCARELKHEAAKQYNVFLGENLICSILCCTDFVSRARGWKLGGGVGPSIRKSIHDNGMAWYLEVAFI